SSEWVGQPEKIQIPSCVEHFPGSSPVGVTIGAGWPGAEQTLAEVEQAEGVEALYPDCFTPAGVLNGSCRVRVWIGSTPCTVGVPGCASWPTWEEDTGESVKCKWGPYEVPVRECRPLKKAYKQGVGVQTLTEVNPETGDLYDPAVEPS